MSWLAAIVALSILIIIHEYGHYACARAMGMHVDRFSVIGIGPVVLRLFEHKGCEFVISAIPFGAYVHIVGMEAEDHAAEEEQSSSAADTANIASKWAEGGAGSESHLPEGCRNYRDCSVWARMLAVVGGPLANYLAAILIMVSVFAFAGTRHLAEIKEFKEDSPAQAAGLEVGDVFVSVDGESVQGEQAEQLVIAATRARAGKDVAITVDREGKELTKTVSLNADGPAMNVQLGGTGPYHPLPLGRAIQDGVSYPFAITGQQLSGLWALITGRSKGDVGGPVQIVKLMKKSWDEGIVAFIGFSAMISTMLGMFNILPMPALDGGRLVFLIYEAVVRKPVDALKEEKIHSIGMLVLLGLLAVLTVKDLRGDPDEDKDKESAEASADRQSELEPAAAKANQN